MRPALDREKAERHLGRFKGKYTYVDVGFRSVPLLKQRADGSCIFFDRERKACTIYRRRPASCQVFFCGKGTRNNRMWSELKEK